MDYLDFEVEIGAGSGRTYPIMVVRSASGEARETMFFPFDELALENQLLSLQNALLRSGGKRRQIFQPEEQAVQNFGRALFNALFTGEVGKRYVVSQLAASQQGKGLRLKLRIRSPELAALPWEFLYDPDGPGFICLSSATPIVRYMELAQPPRPLLVMQPLSILVMASSPKDLPELDIEREKLRLEKATADLRAKSLVELTWLPGQSWYDLQKAMRHGPWHIFHFIGHGGFDTRTDEGLIALEDEEGKAQLLSASQMGLLLADHRSLRLVILNSCEGAKGSERDLFSGTASILVQRGIPAVLAMQYEITDRAAIEFSRAFYDALADGSPVDTAVSEARKAVSLEIANTLEWGTPVLYMRSPDGVLFEMKLPPSQSHEPADRPATKQVSSLNAAASTEVPGSELAQYEASSRITGETPKQARQSANKTSPTAPAPTTSSVVVTPSFTERCPACGAKLLSKGAFCSSCGHQLVQAAHTLQTSSSSPQMTSFVEKQALSRPIGKGDGDKADAEAEEPSPIASVSLARAEEFALTCTLTHGSSVYCVAINPDGRTFISGCINNTIKMWNLYTGELLRTYENKGFSNYVNSLAIGPDEKTIAAGLYRTVNIWNLHTGELLRTLKANSSWLVGVYAVAISPDGQTLISGSIDKAIKTWNLHTGELLRTLTGHTSTVNSVAISPDGQTIVSGSEDDTIKVWSKK